MNRSIVILSCAAGALVVSSGADGALIDLAPGDGTAVVGTTSAAVPELEGVVPQFGDVDTPFQIFGNLRGGPLLFEGVLQSRVSISDDTGNAHFSHRIKDVNGSLNGIIASIEVDDYTGMQTRVEWRIDGLGTAAPSRAQRSGDGSDVEWLFGLGFNAGEESRFLTVVTDQDKYHFGGTATIVLTTGESITLDTWIPTPGTIAAFGFAGLAAVRRRR